MRYLKGERATVLWCVLVLVVACSSEDKAPVSTSAQTGAGGATSGVGAAGSGGDPGMGGAGGSGGASSVGGAGGSYPSLPATITVTESSDVNDVRMTLLGYTNEWNRTDIPMDGEVYNQSFLTLFAQSSLNLMRYAGTSSRTFDWKKAIVMPPSDREVQTGNSSQFKPYWGPVEMFIKSREVNPDMKFVWTLNYAMSAADHADLAEFLVYDGAGNPNGGVDWKQQRIDLGIGDPIAVEMFELGNELDSQMDVNDYVTQSQEVIAAIKGVVPDAKFAAFAATAPWSKSEPWAPWHRAVLQGLSSEIDYIAFHPYYQGIAVSAMEKDYIDRIIADINDPAYSANADIKIACTEHAVWVDDFSNPHDDDRLRGVLYEAHFILRMAQKAGVSHLMKHGLMVGVWGAIEIDGSNRYKTGGFDMIELLTDAFEGGQAVVETAISGDKTDASTTDVNLVQLVIRRSDQGLNIVLINHEAATDRDISFAFEGEYKLTKTVTLSAPTLASRNTGTSQEITVTSADQNIDGFTSYLMPARSLTVLSLDATQ